MNDTVAIVLITLACSGAVVLAGALLALARRTWRVRDALLAVALGGVLTVLAGVIGTAQAMFLSQHDFAVLLTVSAVAGALGLAFAVLLGRGVVADIDLIRRATSDLATHDDSSGAGRRPGGRAHPRLAELREVSAEIERTSGRLAEARHRQLTLEHSRRELVAWVSHDLRTPLAGMRAMAEALEDGVASDPARYHRQIRLEVDHLSRMVDDLFELSRIQSGALRLTMERVQVGDLVAAVVSGARPLAEAGGVRLGARVTPLDLDGDAAGLNRVLGNLLVNAIRHTPSDGVIDVVAAGDDVEVVVSVTDRCGGLPDEELERVFEPGWRGSPARSRGPDGGGGGAGLGLAIARGIIEAHAGRISVSNTDTGCRFEVRIPRQSPATAGVAGVADLPELPVRP
jgi:signal transduction histidine kinase